MSSSDANQKTGKTMYILAWVSALGLLTLWFNGKLEDQYNPNQAYVDGNSDHGQTLVLQQNRGGHYVTGGRINGQKATFMLDTGATQVSIPAHLANFFGLSKGRAGQVMTANGTVTVYQTTIEELRIGNIVLKNVPAHLNPAMHDDSILLGMSALKRLEFTQRGKQLILKPYTP